MPGGFGVQNGVALARADMLPREDRMQLSRVGKGGKVGQVVLPDIVCRSLGGCPPRCGRPPLSRLNSCHRKISGERRSALATPRGTFAPRND